MLKAYSLKYDAKMMLWILLSILKLMIQDLQDCEKYSFWRYMGKPQLRSASRKHTYINLTPLNPTFI